MSSTLTPFHDRPYRLGVGFVLLNPKGQVFVAQRIDTPGAWQMPQGGIDANEDPLHTVFREMEEEIGTCKASYLAETKGWIHYDLPMDIADKVWKGRYRGQKQKWYLMAFEGTDSDINIAAHHPEFDQWKWTDFDTLVHLIVDFKRPLYEQIVEQFRPQVQLFQEETAL